MNSFVSILLIVISFYVVNNIYFTNNIYHLNKNEMCYQQDEVKENLIEKEKVIYEENKKYLNRSCTSSFDEFMEDTVSEINSEDTVQILGKDITNIIYLRDYGKLGCYDYDKVKFAENKFNERVINEIKNKTIIYQIIHYSLKFINMIIYFPTMVTSLISIMFVDFFQNIL